MCCDFHTHLHNDADIHKSLKLIEKYSITSVACSVDIPSFTKTKEIAGKSSLIIPTFGIHPVKADTASTLSLLDPFLLSSPIIGEIGLDQRWATDVPLSDQIRVFEYILDHCSRYKKYCVIHTSGVEEKVYDMLLHFPGAKPVIHWYDGSTELLKKMTNKEWYFTYGLELHYSQKIRNLLNLTPLDLVLSETDNPESETWLGGKEESPLLIRRVVEDIAQVKKISVHKADQILMDNAAKIFTESGLHPDSLVRNPPVSR